MGKSKKNRAASQNQTQHKSQTSAEAFSFGDPIPVLDRRELLDYVECVQTDRWYEPPVSFDGLARTFRAAVHHSSPIAVKCNILTSTYIPHPLLSQQAFSRFVQDYLVLVTPTWRNALTASVKLSPLSLLWQNTPDAD
ncbi:hypothetical protein IE992_09290 [Klebsiella pneumoniae]|uniref:Presumed portal vertex protein n=1 Tax=Klebsiella pneumoniae TaxID=573 RepID=A0A927HT57_KLEPN|nr:hypothetical protein [Klebsiella pneumoniae]